MTPPYRVAAALFFATFSAPAWAQDAAEITLTASEIADGIYVVEGAGGNIGVSVGVDGVLVVDDQVAAVSYQLSQIIAQLTDQSIGFVLNTHWHHDHTGGNEALGDLGALIVSHDNTRSRLMTDQVLAPPMTGGEAPALRPGAWPVITFSDEMTFYFNGEEIRVAHFPNAHTDGDAVIHFVKADVLHMGDVFFNGRYPNIDNGTGGTIDGMIGALDRAYQIAGPNTKIIGGHGPVGDRNDLKSSANMLREVRDRIAALIDAGASEDQTVAAKPLSDLDADWAWFIDGDRMVRHAYKSLVREH